MSYYINDIKFDRKALSQVYGIMNDYDENDLARIPINIRKVIEENRDKNYIFTIDDVQEKNSNLYEETKKILAYLYTNFLSTEEEKVILKKLEKVQYDNSINKYDVRFNKKETDIEKNDTNEVTSITVHKESKLSKILNSIKNFFLKKK